MAAVSYTVLSTSALAGITPDGSRVYVNGIIPNSQTIEYNLLQWRTQYNYACGLTALLFIDNHHVRQYTGSSPVHLTSLQAAKDSIARVYQRIGVALNSSAGTSLDQLAFVARQWGYTNVRRMSASNSTDTNINNLITSLTQDKPVLASLNGGYSANPVKPYSHIVIIFAYNKMSDEYGRSWNNPQNTRNMDTIEYYEPYYGYMRRIPRKDIYLSSSVRTFDMANFAYLQVGR